MSESTRRELSLTGLFAAFMFLQFTVLGLGNHAGEGFLSAVWRERVYYGLQVFVILGFLSHAAWNRVRKDRISRGAVLGVSAVFLAGTAVMLAADSGSLFYLIVTSVSVFCLGQIGGAVYLRMSVETAAGEKTARSMGLGCAAAVAMQFLLQLQWGVTPLLPVFMLAALVLLTLALLRRPETAEIRDRKPQPVPSRRLLFAVLIAAALMLFTGFYNGYIHHLQIQSGYTDYNVYTWPRLMLIPCYLLFAFVGDRRQGKLVPAAALCVGLVATLNSTLAGSYGAYWLNMCLFYLAIAASVSYYNLTFWRLAQRTKQPTLWASMGRVLDSVMVLLTGGMNLSGLSAAAVQALDIAGLAAVIVLMAWNRDLQFSAAEEAAALVTEPDSDPLQETETERISRLAAHYGLTPKEAEVLGLVLHSDLPTGRLGEEIGISSRTIYRHLNSIYDKTGTNSRMALVLKFR